MIKNYKLFKESLLNKLEGPTIEEIIKNNPTKLLEVGIIENNFEYVKLAVKNGANVKYEDNVFLELSSDKNHDGEYTDIIKYLIENGADVKSNFNNAFYKACHYHQFDLADYLVERGANPNSESYYAFRFAAEGGDVEAMKYLSKYNPDVHSNDDYAFMYAILNGCFNVVKYLNETYDFKSDKYSVISFLKNAISGNKSEILDYLLKNGYDLNLLGDEYIDMVLNDNRFFTVSIKNIIKNYLDGLLK